MTGPRPTATRWDTPPAREWEPGDRIEGLARVQHRQGLFQIIEDDHRCGFRGDDCQGCADSARWPDPRQVHDLGQGENGRHLRSLRARGLADA